MIEIEWLLLMLFLQCIKCKNNVSHIYYPKMDIAFELLQYLRNEFWSFSHVYLNPCMIKHLYTCSLELLFVTLNGLNGNVLRTWMYLILRDCYEFDCLTDRSVVVFSLLQVAGDHKYHPECFQCHNCDTYIEDGQTYALVERSRLFWWGR